MTTRNIATMAAEVAEHIAADMVHQGTYWNDENKRGCFIGCLTHSNSLLSAVERFGLTEPLLRIAESIFEGLPADEARDFFGAFPGAIGCDGRDLSRVHWQFLAAELRQLPSVSADIQSVIDSVIAGMDLLATGQPWPAATGVNCVFGAEAALLAAEAALLAAEAAAEAAEAARWAADAARWAADAVNSAAVAARWAAPAHCGDDARLTVRRRQRDLLLRLVSEAPIVEATSS